MEDQVSFIQGVFSLLAVKIQQKMGLWTTFKDLDEH